MARWTLTLSSIYLAIVGLALMFATRKFGVGAVPEDASTELLALLRLLGGPFLGIAALNWLSRGGGGDWLRTVLIANAVGFGAVALNDVQGVLSGEARELARVFLVVHLGFALAFGASLLRRRV
ncbi:hypothetical protein [Brevundimonas viscosa]|uniref:Uncharacterized protein n=1 Tax=Brevundimonas viscosa TaxID=871741 RepID=A0A1I6SUJ9_9CAUL|nr:hypothetical protein [Brevundimonas viscosa]SFS80550.1 hypothetical protein SAMN05192570_2685 [Brevundimonas viscosa]